LTQRHRDTETGRGEDKVESDAWDVAGFFGQIDFVGAVGCGVANSKERAELEREMRAAATRDRESQRSCGLMARIPVGYTGTDSAEA
jgi:hypothetical protein